jgi:predicted RNA-binding Zn-ribbon protein involved in translation (DUF1610 family)
MNKDSGESDQDVSPEAESSNSDTKRECPHCGSEDIRQERDHGDTICFECGWYTEQGSPSQPVDWGEIHGS